MIATSLHDLAGDEDRRWRELDAAWRENSPQAHSEQPMMAPRCSCHPPLVNGEKCAKCGRKR